MTYTVPTHSAAQSVKPVTVIGLYYYPIKSCRGIAVSHARMTDTGFEHDRELVLLNAQTRALITQRQDARMALISPEIDDYTLRLSAPGMPVLEVPVVKEGEREEVNLWGDLCEGIDQGKIVADWFGQYLEVPCQLYRMAEGFARKVNQNYAHTAQDQVSFADGYPCLLVSEESLTDLNGRVGETLKMNRFRPSIVVSGSEIPYFEDQLAQVKIGEVTFNSAELCARCSITTTDQETIKVGKEPLKTLATYRRSPQGAVMFGQYLIPEAAGEIAIGDQLEVIQYL